jgi:hypothetical protein
MVHAPPTVLGPIMGIPQKEVPPLAGARPTGLRACGTPPNRPLRVLRGGHEIRGYVMACGP